MPKRQESIVAIDNAVDMLKRMAEISTAANASYKILVRLSKRVPRSAYHLQHFRWKCVKIPEAQLESAPQIDTQANPLTAQDLVQMAQQPRRDSTSRNSFVFLESCSSGSTPQSECVGVRNLPSSSTSHSISSSILGQPSPDILCCNPLSGRGGAAGSGLLPITTYTNVPPGLFTGAADAVDESGFVTIGNNELGNFSEMWDWQSLNPDFVSSQTASHYPPMIHPCVKQPEVADLQGQQGSLDGADNKVIIVIVLLREQHAEAGAGKSNAICSRSS